MQNIKDSMTKTKNSFDGLFFVYGTGWRDNLWVWNCINKFQKAKSTNIEKNKHRISMDCMTTIKSKWNASRKVEKKGTKETTNNNGW